MADMRSQLPSTIADKQRILYILGWMHAEEAQPLKENARTARSAKVIGRGVDLTWLLKPVIEDQRYLLGQLRRVLNSPPERPTTLGPWADEWLQKRLVRAISGLRLFTALPDLRELRAHIGARPAPVRSRKGTSPWDQSVPKRERLVEAVQEAIDELERGNP